MDPFTIEASPKAKEAEPRGNSILLLGKRWTELLSDVATIKHQSQSALAWYYNMQMENKSVLKSELASRAEWWGVSHAVMQMIKVWGNQISKLAKSAKRWPKP